MALETPPEDPQWSIGPVLPGDGFAAICFAPSLRRRIKWAACFFSVSVGLVIWAGIADKSHGPAWIALVASATWLGHVFLSLLLSRQHSLPIPQIFMDREGLLKLGLWDWEQYTWSELSDFVVCEMDNDGSTAHYLLAFAKNEDLPKKDSARYRGARLRLQLPYVQADSKRDATIYNSVCDWLNEWRRHVMSEGSWPHPHHLRRIDGLFPVVAVSDAEHARWWQVFAVRYPGIRRPAAGSQ
jgi:hypothetical protein